MEGINDSARRILNFLRKSERAMTIEELCGSLKVTPMAVHRPITLLENKGLITSELLRQHKRGRPVRVYKLTETGDELFPKNYSGLVMELLEQLGTSGGLGRIRKLLGACFKKRAQTHRDVMKGKNLRSRVETISKILNEINYMAEQQEVNDKKFVIKLLNCPISKVAKEYPQACSCEQHFLSELLQAKVERDQHILNGQNYCSYIVQRK